MQEDRDRVFEVLHEEWAPKALAKILELRGFYIKVHKSVFRFAQQLNLTAPSSQVGQMAASNVGNAFPEKWVRTMEVRLFLEWGDYSISSSSFLV